MFYYDKQFNDTSHSCFKRFYETEGSMNMFWEHDRKNETNKRLTARKDHHYALYLDTLKNIIHVYELYQATWCKKKC